MSRTGLFSRLHSGSAKTVTRSVLLVTAAVALLGVAGCEAKPAAAPPTPVPGTAAPRQVTVVGEGKVDGTPDTLTISVSIEATAADAVGASNQTSARMTALTDALVAQGIDRKDVATTQVSLGPQYSGANGTVIVGYTSTNAIDVRVRNIATGPQVFGVITTTGGDATRITSSTYSINDDSELIKNARSAAFEDAKNRAQQYADLSGLPLGKVVSISETGTATPPPAPVRFDVAAEAVPLSPGQQTVGFSVTVVWELG